MSEVKWIKITTDIFDDEKILLIESLPDAYAIIVVWFKLLCLAGKMNNSGVFIMNNQLAYTDKMLATIFRMKETTVKYALQTFEQFGMVSIIDGVITIPNWNKHQSLDSYEKKKQRDREYQERRRTEQKALISPSGKKSSDNRLTVERFIDDSSSDVAFSEREEDKEGEVEREIEVDSRDYLEEEKKKTAYAVKKETAPRFQPPAVEDVAEYCKQRRNGVDAQQFVNFYTSKGWMVGKNRMRDWKAAVRTWEAKDGKATAIPASEQKPKKPYSTSPYAPPDVRNGLRDPYPHEMREYPEGSNHYIPYWEFPGYKG